MFCEINEYAAHFWTGKRRGGGEGGARGRIDSHIFGNCRVPEFLYLTTSSYADVA